jgi:hypothetical protein
MRTQIQNPFVDWKKQCFEWLAVDKRGFAVAPHSKDAVCWCARGWIYKKFQHDKSLAGKILRTFNLFMMDEHCRPITQVNDVMRLRPREFEREFDKFIEKGGLLYAGKNGVERREFDFICNKNSNGRITS